jgi:hypothetical protein
VPRASSASTAADTDPWNRAVSSTASSTPRSTTTLGDRYNQPAEQTQNPAGSWSERSQPATSPGSLFGNQPFPSNQPTTSMAGFPNQPVATQPSLLQPGSLPTTMSQPGYSPAGSNPANLGYGNQNPALFGQPMNAEQLPWIPLLVVSLSLAGSLGANLFLGWSYADARHRYHLLVRRTSESLHKAAGLAA